MSFFSRLFGPSMPPLPSSGPILFIDYAFEHRLGIFMHGSLYLKDMNASAMWSTTFMGKRNTQPFAITTELFTSFWKAMDELSEFKRGWLKDPNVRPDLTKHNIVAMVIDEAKPNEPLFKRSHAIPVESASARLRDLLAAAGLGSCK